ncbi:MAG: LLM class flavin-dependent oxidoreductase [Gammaproteobacteria bacterium]
MEVWIRPSYYYLSQLDEPMPYPVPGHMWDRSLGEKLYGDHMRFIRSVDQLGFDGVLFTEHHAGPNGGLTPSPTVFLAAASQVTERIKLVIMGIALALYPHPVRVAEELAMLDNLCHGRLEVGFISSGAPSLYAYNLPVSEEGGRYHEAYDLVIKAWTEKNPFEWHSQYYNYKCVSILPRPLQLPHPPIWTVAASTEGLQWAAEHRLRLICSGTLGGAAENLNYFRNYAATECGWTPEPTDLGIARELYIGRTESQVREKMDELFHRKGDMAYKQVSEAPQLANLHQERRATRSYTHQKQRTRRAGEHRTEEAMRGGSFLIGDPDSITEQILHQREVTGAGVVAIRLELGDVDLKEVTDSLELFSREVLPVLKRA